LPHDDQEIKKFIRKCYEDVLGRDADSDGLRSFTNQLKEKIISYDDLPNILRKSDEFRASFTSSSDIKPNSLNWSKQEWENEINYQSSINSKNFKNNSKKQVNTNLEHKDFFLKSLSKNCIPAQARVLVIGCRNNTILKNMAKIFNELIICDISIEHVRKINMMLKEKQNSIVYENNGKDLSIFTDNYFDFCYSFEQLKFVPDKKIFFRFVKEINRIIKNNGIFIFQVKGINDFDISKKKSGGIFFSKEEIYDLANKNKFSFIHNYSESSENYWVLFKAKKE